jgi:hypothetical protein
MLVNVIVMQLEMAGIAVSAASPGMPPPSSP